jgi:hypothetical protein
MFARRLVGIVGDKSIDQSHWEANSRLDSQILFYTEPECLLLFSKGPKV